MSKANSKGNNGNPGDGRDPKTGRFAPGWKGGPGNPKVARMAEYQLAMQDAITPEDVTEVFGTLVEAATVQAGIEKLANRLERGELRLN